MHRTGAVHTAAPPIGYESLRSVPMRQALKRWGQWKPQGQLIKAWSDSRLAGVALFLEVGDYQLFRVRVVSIEQLDTDAYICSSNIYFGIIMYHACMLASAEETGGYVVGLLSMRSRPHFYGGTMQKCLFAVHWMPGKDPQVVEISDGSAAPNYYKREMLLHTAPNCRFC